MSDKTNSIVEKNLEKMVGKEEGNLGYALTYFPESIGGTSINKMPCYTARFFYRDSTGQILYFGNIQHVPKRIREDRLNSEGLFVFAVDVKHKRDVLVSVCYEPRSSDTAKVNLDQTIKAYNKQKKRA